MSQFATAPDPPYYAVIFTSERNPGGPGDDSYSETADRMLELARGMPGYLGVESARDGNGLGITVSYWASDQAIANWKRQLDHQAAQDRGRRTFSIANTS